MFWSRQDTFSIFSKLVSHPAVRLKLKSLSRNLVSFTVALKLSWLLVPTWDFLKGSTLEFFSLQNQRIVSQLLKRPMAVDKTQETPIPQKTKGTYLFHIAISHDASDTSVHLKTYLFYWILSDFLYRYCYIYIDIIQLHMNNSFLDF